MRALSPMFVSISPGVSRETPTPSGFTYSASASVNPVTPNFAVM